MQHHIINTERPLNILLVEDKEGDAKATRMHLELANIPYYMITARTGERALEILRNEDGVYPTPDLILLDLTLPKKSGLDIFEEIKADNRLKHIRIVILTASNYEDAPLREHHIKKEDYAQKPLEVEKILELAQRNSEMKEFREWKQELEKEKGIKRGIWLRCTAFWSGIIIAVGGTAGFLVQHSKATYGGIKAFWIIYMGEQQ